MTVEIIGNTANVMSTAVFVGAQLEKYGITCTSFTSSTHFANAKLSIYIKPSSKGKSYRLFKGICESTEVRSNFDVDIRVYL